MSEFVLNVTLRDDMGKGASRRLRREAGVVPAIIYGGDRAPQPISIRENELRKALENEAFYSHLIMLKADDKEQEVVLKDLQRHPAKGHALHADFMRVTRGQKFHAKVPLHFINEDKCKGVKQGSGIISHNMTELEINVLPKDLPEFIEVDMTDVDVEQIVHISDLKLPEGVESVALSHGSDHDLPVVSVHKGKGSSASSEDESAE